MAKLGYVGLGVMGSRVVKRLLEAGHQVTGYNRTKSKAQWLLDAGMKWADTPRAVAEVSDITFTMVTNTNALRNVMEGEDGLLAGISKGKIHVDMSTVSPAFSEGVLLAEKSGIKREIAVEVLTNSVIASPMVKYRGPFVLEMPDEAWFDCYMMQKDMTLALELGRELSVPLPTTAATNEFLTAARGMGFEKQ